MSKTNYTPRFKFNVVVESYKTDSVTQVGRKYNVNPSLISTWRRHHLDSGYQIFESTVNKEVLGLRKQVARLEQLVGKKETELALMKNFFDFHTGQNGT